MVISNEDGPLDLTKDNKAVPLLRICKTILMKQGFLNVTQVFDARLPLLKFCHGEIEVDLCLNNNFAVANTSLLYSYAKLDERVGILGKLLKCWAKDFGLCSIIDGSINSYGIVLMTIFYLQYIGFVPNLQATEEFISTSKSDVSSQESSEYHSKPVKSWYIIELLVGFFQFYRDFNWGAHAISIRLGGHSRELLRANMTRTGGKENNSEELVLLEDPYDLCHNLGARVTQLGLQRMKDAIIYTQDAILQGCEIGIALSNIVPPVLRQFGLRLTTGAYTNTLPEGEYVRLRIYQNTTLDELNEVANRLGARYYTYPDNFCNMFGTSWCFLVFENLARKRYGMSFNEYRIGSLICRLFSSTSFGFHDAIYLGQNMWLQETNVSYLESIPSNFKSKVYGLDASLLKKHQDNGVVFPDTWESPTFMSTVSTGGEFTTSSYPSIMSTPLIEREFEMKLDFESKCLESRKGQNQFSITDFGQDLSYIQNLTLQNSKNLGQNLMMEQDTDDTKICQVTKPLLAPKFDDLFSLLGYEEHLGRIVRC
jgi:hypothetical protein